MKCNHFRIETFKKDYLFSLFLWGMKVYRNLSKKTTDQLKRYLSKPYLEVILQQINKEVKKSSKLADRWSSIDNIVSYADSAIRDEVRAYVDLVENKILAPRIYRNNKRNYSYNLRLCYDTQVRGNDDEVISKSFNIYSKRGWAWTKRVDAINIMLDNNTNISTKTLEALSEMRDVAYKWVDKNKRITNKEDVIKCLKRLEERIAERKLMCGIDNEKKNNWFDGLSNYTTNIFSKIKNRSSTIMKSAAAVLIGATLGLNWSALTSEYSFGDGRGDKSVPVIPPVDAHYQESSLENSVKGFHGQKGNLPPEGYVYWKTVQAKITAYEPTEYSCGEYADGKTSIGDDAWELDGVAVDPRAIPYRTIVYIPGKNGKKGVCLEADDTGGAMRRSWKKRGQYHIDIRMEKISDALAWGVQNMKVKLYRKIPSDIASK